MASGHLLNSLLPIASVQLGRLVLNAKCPHQDFLDPLDNRPAETEFVQTVQKDFSETRKFSKTSKLRSYLSTAFSASYQVHEDNSATLSAPLVTTHDLKNSGSWFTSACAHAPTQRFLEEAFDNRASVYLIVGFRTVHNAKMVRSVTTKRSGSAKGESPLYAGAGGMVGPGAESSRCTQNGQDLSYHAEGDQVFAVLYRKVKLKFMSRRKAGNMSLEANNRWKSCWDWRDFQTGTDDEDEDDIVEAELTDSDLDISDDEYPNEEKLESSQRIPGPSCGEHVSKDVYQTLLGKVRSAPETKIKDLSQPGVLVEERGESEPGSQGRHMCATGIEKRSEMIASQQEGTSGVTGDIQMRWIILFFYGVMISLCFSVWFYYSGHLGR